MAKEFKDFDKMFSTAEIEACRNTYLVGRSSNQYSKWHEEINVWSNAEVREAVYFAEGSHRWQLVRVSMKGLTTQEKLYMLHMYFLKHRGEHWVKCRVDNYIGALVRGGQLSVGTYEVLK